MTEQGLCDECRHSWRLHHRRTVMGYHTDRLPAKCAGDEGECACPEYVPEPQP